MNFFKRFLCLSTFGLLLAVSCAKEETGSFDELENQSLKAWITQHRPELVGNYQEEGGYYVDVIEAGDASAAPVNDTICWVSFDFTGRDLAGNIILTRNAANANQVGTFTRYTHYVPYYRYCGEYNLNLLEGTHLAMRNTLHLDKDYAAARGLAEDFLLREGSVVELYLPSRVVGSGGVSASGGYEGQYSLDARRPYFVRMEICERVKNPLEKEGDEVDAFCEMPLNGGLKVYNKDEKDPDTKPLPEDPKDPEHPYNIAERWVSVNDSIPQVYVNYRYDPARDRIAYPKAYNPAGTPAGNPYKDFAAMEEEIHQALVKRFHADGEEPYEGVEVLDADTVKLSGTANIWYITRFLDGFIIDTNIDEVKQIAFGGVKSSGSATSYTPEEGGMITSWYYTIPNLKYGQWAAMITSSTNAYGSVGVSGGTNTSTSNSGYSSAYLDYLNYMSYANAYYGSSGYYNPYYGGYYGYGGYGSGYYDPYYGYGYGYGYGGYGDYGDTTTTTETSITTEIPPFTPLIFEIYIEPKSN